MEGITITHREKKKKLCVKERRESVFDVCFGRITASLVDKKREKWLGKLRPVRRGKNRRREKREPILKIRTYSALCHHKKRENF